MVKSRRTPKTEVGNPHFTGSRQVAIPGMAGFAGEGPPGTTCVQCVCVDPGSRRRTRDGLKGKCLKYTALMIGAPVSPSFNLHTASCVFFKALR